MKKAENTTNTPAEPSQIPLPLSAPPPSSLQPSVTPSFPARPAARAAAVWRRIRNPRALAALGAALAVILVVVMSRGPGKAPDAEVWRAAAAEFASEHGLALVSFSESPVRPAGATRPGEAENRGRAVTKLPGALYEPVEARAYLADELKLDVSVPEKIERLLAGPGATRIQQLAGVDPKDNGSLGSLSLVRETAPAGARIEFDVTMSATLTNAGWRAHVTGSAPVTAAPGGRPLGEFDGRVLDVSRESDVEQIRRIVSRGGETLARLEKARAQFYAELEAGGDRALEKVAGQFRAGAFFLGTLAHDPSGENSKSPNHKSQTITGAEASQWNAGAAGMSPRPEPAGDIADKNVRAPENGGAEDELGVSVEVTGVNAAERTLTALLRTENGWSDSRAMTGRFSSDPATGLPLLTLESDAAQAARGAGPLVGDEAALRLEFAAQADALTSRIAGWQGNLRLLADAARVSAIARLRAAEGRLRAEFASGRVFLASARPTADGGAHEEFLLRIKKLDTNGALEAVLESATNHWTRTVRGGLVANRHRAAGRPLRLESGAAERVPGAARMGLLGADGFSLAFGEEGGAFSARTADGGTVTLAPASPRDVAAVARRRAELRELAFLVVREGAAYDGTLARDGGAGERVRLRFDRVDTLTGEVSAVLDSLAWPGARRALRGAVEPGAGALVLETGDDGAAKGGANARESWFGGGGAFVFDLDLSLREIAGRSRGQWWSLAFPVSGGRATVLPSDRWPADAGAHVWADGQWRALPANNGRVKRSLLQKTGRAADTVLSWVWLGSKDEEGSAAGTLVFDGDTPAPAVPGAGVTLLFRGALARPANVGEEWPLLEVAPLEMKKAGADRKVAMVTVTKDFASAGDRRETTVMEELEPGVTLLRVGRSLPPGRYAFYAAGAGGAAYEFEVR
ncbi:hypothetical protein OH491_08090 [Termitidicoccus mucosus]|uniref:Uncharacterized protein n=1 Tax=Termitidicoccus mucosus TaxID=1184151 RepID=A0A178IDD0_9BACT|nr:hypothetical protein AW736_20960 [Opitutaceae bacterium TSB47]